MQGMMGSATKEVKTEATALLPSGQEKPHVEAPSAEVQYSVLDRRTASGALRNQSIDGLRTLLALKVVLEHTSWTKNDEYDSWLGPERLFVKFWSNKENRTALFYFVLSGFVIGRSATPPPSSMRASLIWFFGKFLRLAPLYYASVILYIATLYGMMARLKGVDPSYSSECPIGPPIALPLTLLMVQSWWPVTIYTNESLGQTFGGCGEESGYVPFAINGQLWFASCIFFIYLVYAFLGRYLIHPKLGVWGMLAGALLSFPAFIGMSWLPWPEKTTDQYPFNAFFMFMLGIYTGAFERLTRGWSFRSSVVWYGVDTVVVVAAVWLMVTINFPESIKFPDMSISYGVFGPIFIFAGFCEPLGLVHRILSDVSLAKLGPVGYGVYCFQWVVMYLFEIIIGGPVQTVETYVTYLMCVFAFAKMFEYFFEAPVRDRLTRWHKTLT